MLNIVIPMAGRGSRFANAGYTLPKPLIPVFDQPMIEIVEKNLKPKQEYRFIFLVLEEHIKKYNIGQKLEILSPGCVIVAVSGVTEGAACTVLLARSLIDNHDALMIANSDQWVDIDINDYLEVINCACLDGLIMTMEANDPKWSYVETDSNGYVTRVVEKEVVSNEATVGIYNYARGCDFVAAADRMISSNERVNNEFYVAPVYNHLIKSGAKVGIYNIGLDRNGMYGLGVPNDLEFFISHGPWLSQ